MPQYSDTLYSWISQQDPTFSSRYTPQTFADKAKDQEYTDKLFTWIQDKDPSFSQRYTPDKFREKLNPPSEEGFFSKAWNYIFPKADTLATKPDSILINGENIPVTPRNKSILEARKRQEEFKTKLSSELSEPKIGPAVEQESEQPKADTTPESIVKSMMLANGLDVTGRTRAIPEVSPGSVELNLKPTGDPYQDMEKEKEYFRVMKQADDLLSKMGYAKDPKTGEYKKADNFEMTDAEVKKQLTGLQTQLKNKLTEETNASKEEYKKNIPTLPGLPIEVSAFYQLYKSITPEIQDKDLKHLQDMQGTLDSLNSVGNSLETKAKLEPVLQTAKGGFIPPDMDFANPNQVTDIKNNIDASTAGYKTLAQQALDPKWAQGRISDGIDVSYAVDDYSNKAAKNKLYDTGFINPFGPAAQLNSFVRLFRAPGMSDLEKSEFYLKGTLPYKEVLEGSVRESNAQLDAINGQINQMIDLTKSKQLSDKGESYLQHLQLTRDALVENLTAQKEALSAIGTSIKTNAVAYVDNESQKDFLEDRYKQDRFLYSSRAAGEAITGIPKDLFNLAAKLGDVAEGQGYRSLKFAESANDYIPQNFQKAMSNSLSFDVKPHFDKEGKEVYTPWYDRLSADPVGLWYTTLNVGIQSALLGGAGALVEGLGAKALVGIAGKELVPALMFAEQTGSLGARALMASGRFGAGAIDTGLGFIAPSILLFGDQMIEAELKKGRTLEEATALGILRAGIEGLTERINPFEMDLIKGRVLTGELKNLGEDVVFRNILLKNGLSKRAFDLIYSAGKGIRAGVKVGFMESVEEEVGLFLNDMASRAVQKSDATYKNNEPFDLQNVVNTALITMATMAPQIVTGGVGGGIEESKSVKYSRFVVGANPSIYKAMIADRLNTGGLTKDEALQASERVDSLNSAYLANKAKIDSTLADPALTPGQKKEYVSDLFNASYQFQNLANQVANMPEAEKKAKLAKFAEEAQRVQTLRDQRFADRNDVNRLQIDYKNLENERQFVSNLGLNYSAERINNTKDAVLLQQTLTNVKDELAKIEDMPEDEQPFNVKARLESIQANLETKLDALTSGKPSQISQYNPEVLEVKGKEAQFNEPPAPKEVTAGEDEGVVATEEKPVENEAKKEETIEAPAPVEAPKEEPVGEEDKPETGGIENVDELMKLHVKYAATKKRPLSFHRWLETKEGKVAQKSLQPKPTPTITNINRHFIRDIKNGNNDMSDDDMRSNNKDSLSESGQDVKRDDQGNVQRTEGNIVYLNDRLIIAHTVLATSTRAYDEVVEGGVSRIEEKTNALDHKFDPILDPTSLDEGTGLVARVNTNPIFDDQIEDDKAKLRRNKDLLVEQGIPEAEIEADLKDPATFIQIDVFEEGGTAPIGSVHVISYINPSRVVPETDDSPNNLATEYRALKALRHQILAHLAISEEIPLMVTGKSNGFFFTEKDGKVQSTKNVITNKKVTDSIQIVKNETVLNRGFDSTINKAIPGGAYIIIPTGNNSLFAWQVNAKKASGEVVDSYMAAIDFYQAYKAAIEAKDLEKVQKLTGFMDQEGFEGYDLTSLAGLKEYLNNLVPSSSKTSDFTSNFAKQTTQQKQIKFLDFNETEGVITFSNNRSLPEVFLEDPSLIDLPSKHFEEAGIYRYKIRERSAEVEQLLREHLSQRRLSTSYAAFSTYAKSKFSLPLIRVTNGNFEKVEEGKVKQKFRNYKEYLLENTETPLLEHKISDSAFAYFQQPSIGFGLDEEAMDKLATEEQKKRAADLVKKAAEQVKEIGQTQEELEKLAEELKSEKKVEETKEVPKELLSLQKNIEDMTGEKVDITPLAEENLTTLSDDELLNEFGDLGVEPPTQTPEVKLPTEEESKEKKDECDGK